jgi:hypothetical protein
LRISGPPFRTNFLSVLRRWLSEGRRSGVDTLKGSRIVDLKELRFSADAGVWRVAFVFATDSESPCGWLPATSAVSCRTDFTGD